jgi:hypothetical protein
VHVLSPNIYRTTSEALESFDYIANNGKSAQLFPFNYVIQLNFLPFRIVGANACVSLWLTVESLVVEDY